MSKYLTATDVVLWLVVIAAEWLLLYFLTTRKHYRCYPVFTSYIAFCVIKECGLMFLAYFAPYSVYYYAWWAGSGIRILLSLGIVFEIAAEIYRPLETIPAGKIQSLCWKVTGIALLCISIAYLLPLGYKHPIQELFNTVDRTATVVVIAVMCVVILDSDRLLIPKTRCAYGICAGGLFFLLLDAALTTISASYSVQSQAVVRNFSMGGFTISELVWLWYFRNPPPELKKVSTAQLQELTQLLDQWQVLPKNSSELSTTSSVLTRKLPKRTLIQCEGKTKVC